MTPSRCRGRRAAAEAGVWQVLVRDETEELGPAIRNLTGGDGVDIVCDGSGKALFDVSIAILHFRGVFVHYGRAGRPIPPLDLGNNPTEFTSSAYAATPLTSRSLSGGTAHYWSCSGSMTAHSMSSSTGPTPRRMLRWCIVTSSLKKR